MANLQQDQQQVGDQILPGSFRGTGRSNRIAAVDLEGLTPLDNNHDELQLVAEGPGWRKFFSYVGPGFLVSMAYLDPNNLETDLQAGASRGYQLLWVILIGLIFALIIQTVAANLGVITGKHLSEMCKAEYPKFVNVCLWLLAEIAVIGADIPEVIGTSFALNILFHVPLWAGVIMTGFSSLLLLGVQRYGERKLELLIALLVFIMAACFFGELSYVKPPPSEVIKGLFTPKLSGHGAAADAIALIGSLVMPHNLFLHSALVLSRKVPNTVDGINDARRYFVMELSFALFLALLINVSIVSVSGAVCSPNSVSPDILDQCNNLTAKSASFLLKNVLGKSSSIVYGIALLASGQSATITSTYAGQYIMQGFWDIRMKKWARNLMTRSMAIVPSLVVTLVSGSSGASRLIIITSIVLSIELPFALIPLLKFTSSFKKMGPHKSSIYTIVLSWVLGLLVIGINVYYLVSSFVGWLLHNKLPKVGNVFIGIIVFPLMAVYVVAVIYLAFRKDTLFTYSEADKNDPIDRGSSIEGEQGKSDEALEMVQDTNGIMTW